MERNVLRKLSLALLLCLVASLMLAVAAQCQEPGSGYEYIYVSSEVIQRTDVTGDITTLLKKFYNSDGDQTGGEYYTNPKAGPSVNEHHEDTYTNTASGASWTLCWDVAITQSGQ